MSEESDRKSRRRQVCVAGGILAVLSSLVATLLLGWPYVPGWVGQALGMVAGILCTPFFMEASFIIIGLIVVVGVNTWRQRREGDEYVWLEFKDPVENGKVGTD